MFASSANLIRLSLVLAFLALSSRGAPAAAAEVKHEAGGLRAPIAATPTAAHQLSMGIEPFDLKRLTGPQLAGGKRKQQQQQQQLQEPLALATAAPGRRSAARVSYREIPLNVADLMLTSPSMPAGRRRLDVDARDLELAGAGGFQPIEASRSGALHYDHYEQAGGGGGALSAPEILMTAAAAVNQHDAPAWDAALSGIVDNGGPSAPNGRLMAKLANDNYNRLALASAVRRQRAMQSGGGGAGQGRGARQQAAGAGRRAGLQASQTRRRQVRGGGGRDGDEENAENAEDETGGEYDELDGRGSDSASQRVKSGAGDEEEEGEGEEERGLASRRSSSSAASDPFFSEPDERRADGDDDFDELDGGAGRTSEGRLANNMRQRQLSGQNNRRSAGGGDEGETGAYNNGAAGAASAARRRQRQKPATGGRQQGGDDEIDSMNSRQQFVTASLQGGTNNGQDGVHLRAPLAANSINWPRRQADAGNSRRQDANILSYADNNNGGGLQLRSTSAKQLAQVEDSDLSASHIRNSATDLQAAAGHHHHGHGHYYQHVEVPKKKAWKFGFKRGNHKHEIMKHEKGYKHKFHTEFKWHAKEKCKKKSKCKSVGKMTWDYKHHKKHHG